MLEYNSVNQLDVLNEYYIGKNQYTEILLNDIKAIRAMSKRNKNAYISKTPEVLRFARHLEEIFGYTKVYIVVDLSTTMNAAVTLPVTCNYKKLKLKNCTVAEKDRIYFTEEADMKVMFLMFKALLDYDKISDEEVLAAYLHEIGHTFEFSISPMSNILQSTANFFTIYALINNILVNPVFGILYAFLYASSLGMLVYKIIDFFNEITHKNPEACNDFTFFMNLVPLDIVDNTRSDDYFEVIAYVIKSKIERKITSTFINRAQLLKGYRGEVIADSFATMFGYGPELASMLTNLSASRKPTTTKEVSVIFKYLNILNIPFEYLNYINDPHPGMSTRFKKQIEYLEYELLKEDIDPELKKELTKSIQKIKTSMIKALENKPKKEDIRYFNKLFRMMYINLNEYTIKHRFFASKIEEDIDEIFKDVDRK